MDDATAKTFYKCREVSLLHDGLCYTVHVAGEQESRGIFANPLHAWGCFIDTLDMRVRRRIGDMLEREGKDRNTGERIIDTQQKE